MKKFGKLEMKINGVAVTEASDMHTCYALKNKDGHVWKPNGDGQYEISAHIAGATEYSYFRVSSFIFL